MLYGKYIIGHRHFFNDFYYLCIVKTLVFIRPISFKRVVYN